MLVHIFAWCFIYWWFGACLNVARCWSSTWCPVFARFAVIWYILMWRSFSMTRIEPLKRKHLKTLVFFKSVNTVTKTGAWFLVVLYFFELDTVDIFSGSFGIRFPHDFDCCHSHQYVTLSDIYLSTLLQFLWSGVWYPTNDFPYLVYMHYKYYAQLLVFKYFCRKTGSLVHNSHFLVWLYIIIF